MKAYACAEDGLKVMSNEIRLLLQQHVGKFLSKQNGIQNDECITIIHLIQSGVSAEKIRISYA